MSQDAASTTEQAIDDMARQILKRYHEADEQDRILVGVAGIPGSGKSTLAYPLVDKLNTLLGCTQQTAISSNQNSHVDSSMALFVNNDDNVVHSLNNDTQHKDDRIAIAVGLDGWHYTRAQLEQFPDPLEAKRRRGAAFTFDHESYINFIKQLRTKPMLNHVQFKTFSHELKDPKLNSFDIEPHHRIIVIEGLYCLLNIDEWKFATNELNERIWVECDRNLARQRLIKRHLKSGVETELNKAIERVDKSDLLNADFIIQHLTTPTFVLKSTEDSQFASQ
ncbi:hypothetical protein OIO90_004904 [Microbotryomycetes sp. JL221]|nr:hypothetical protein OIO90_004904 [Microbotryomycetes sp. JL221]